MKKEYQQKNIIGCDETGVSDYLTPLVAAAVFVPNGNINKLIDMGITDSKKISDKKIKILAERIKPIVISRATHLSQSGYNKLNESLNTNELKMFLHLKLINQMETKLKDINLIIIDQFSTPKSINRYIKKLLGLNYFNFKSIQNELKTVIKGEQEHISVAAASVIARAKLLELMEQQNKKWNTKFPLGINDKVENFIVKFIDKHGTKTLKEVVKIKFKNTQKLFGNNIIF